MNSLTDPGLQPARTALAWSRTGLAIFVNAVAVLRSGASRQSTLVTALGIGLLVAAAAAILCGTWRRHRLMQGTQPIAPPTWLMRVTMASLWLICISGLASILSSTHAT